MFRLGSGALAIGFWVERVLYDWLQANNRPGFYRTPLNGLMRSAYRSTSNLTDLCADDEPGERRAIP